MTASTPARGNAAAHAALWALALAVLAGCAGPKPAPAPPPAATEPAAPAPAPPPAPAPAPVAASPTPAPRAAEPAARPARGSVDAETLARYRAWIDEARLKHPYTDTADRMVAVMMCESKGNASATNPAGPYVGLFQYRARTWSGAWNDYRGESIKDPKAQIFATAQAWSRKMQGQWGCYKRTN